VILQEMVSGERVFEAVQGWKEEARANIRVSFRQVLSRQRKVELKEKSTPFLAPMSVIAQVKI